MTNDNADDEEIRRETAMRRVRDMARSGFYRDYAAVETEFRSSPDYPRIRSWFADELFQQQIDALCHEARSKGL
jgi:hypothetical protein